jgi:hypothetical protein
LAAPDAPQSGEDNPSDWTPNRRQNGRFLVISVLNSRTPAHPVVGNWEEWGESDGFVSRFIAFHVKRKTVCVK